MSKLQPGRCGQRQWASRKRRVLERDGILCWLCGCATNSILNHPRAASLDHVVPLSEGGTNALENLRVACRTCNNGRAAVARAMM